MAKKSRLNSHTTWCFSGRRAEPGQWYSKRNASSVMKETRKSEPWSLTAVTKRKSVLLQREQLMTPRKSGSSSLCLQRGMYHRARVYTVPVYCSKGTCYIFVDVLLPCVVDAILFLYEELPKHKFLFRVSHKISIYLNTEVCKEIEKEWGNAQRYSRKMYPYSEICMFSTFDHCFYQKLNGYKRIIIPCV